jgi:hypothetical protein
MSLKAVSACSRALRLFASLVAVNRSTATGKFPLSANTLVCDSTKCIRAEAVIWLEVKEGDGGCKEGDGGCKEGVRRV